MASDINSNNLVTKSNTLIEANYKLSEVEQKIILSLISLVQPSDKEFQPITFSIKDFIKFIGGNSITRYRELEEITKRLMSKVNEIRIDDRLVQVQWLSLAEYNYKKGTIDLTLHNYFRPYLLELKQGFTSYQLKNVSKLKGNYTIRIYELLKQYERIKERTFELNDLKQKLGASEIYPAYGNFKQRVLLPAQKQINKKSDITIEFQEIKQGRSVNKIKFLIKPKDTIIESIPKPIVKKDKESEKDIVIEEEETTLDLFTIVEKEDISEIQKLAAELGIKVTKKVVKKWLEYGKENVIEAMKSIRYNSKIQNPIGFISYKLNSRIEEEKDIIQIDPVREAIRQFIMENVPDRKVKKLELLPEYMIKEDAIKKFREFVNEEEANRWWQENKKEILRDLKTESEKMLI